MANFNFSIEGVLEWTKTLEERGIAVHRRAAQIMGHRIIADVPIDTGFLLSTMRIGTSISPTGDRFIRPPGFKDLGVESRKINAVTRAAKGLKKGGTFTIEFQAEYAEYAHEGTHLYGGYFYVSRNVRFWSSIAKRAAAEVG